MGLKERKSAKYLQHPQIFSTFAPVQRNEGLFEASHSYF